MKRVQGIEFELPDDLVIGTASGDEDERWGEGSTLPPDEHAPTQPSPTADGNTMPPDLAPATGGVFTASESGSAQAIFASPRRKGRLPQDGPIPKRVLVVDDDLTMRLYMRSRLMLRGNVQLLEAASGEEALNLVRTHLFDAVLLDVDMGSQNGFETCRAVRSHVRSEGGKQPRIYIITSRSGVINKMRARMAGADAFLSKPPHPGELAQLLEQV
jgi:CheY-like chemotaxis protein